MDILKMVENSSYCWLISGAAWCGYKMVAHLDHFADEFEWVKLQLNVNKTGFGCVKVMTFPYIVQQEAIIEAA